MANIISDETIEYVGILAKLELSPEEKEEAKKDMGRMLDYIDKLNELDTQAWSLCPTYFRCITCSGRMWSQARTRGTRFSPTPPSKRTEHSKCLRP